MDRANCRWGKISSLGTTLTDVLSRCAVHMGGASRKFVTASATVLAAYTIGVISSMRMSVQTGIEQPP
jgi:hypothetical protein